PAKPLRASSKAGARLASWKRPVKVIHAIGSLCEAGPSPASPDRTHLSPLETRTGDEGAQPRGASFLSAAGSDRSSARPFPHRSAGAERLVERVHHGSQLHARRGRAAGGQGGAGPGLQAARGPADLVEAVDRRRPGQLVDMLIE